MSQTKAKKEAGASGATSSPPKRQTYEEAMNSIQVEVSSKFYELFQSVGAAHNRLVNDLDTQRADYEKSKEELKHRMRCFKEREAEFLSKEKNYLAREKRFEDYETQKEHELLQEKEQLKLEKQLIEGSKKTVSSLEQNVSARAAELEQYHDKLKENEEVLKKKEKELKEKEKNFTSKVNELTKKMETIEERSKGLDAFEAKLFEIEKDLKNQQKALEDEMKANVLKEEAQARLEVKEAKCMDAQLMMERERYEMEQKISSLDDVLQVNLLELENTKEELAKKELECSVLKQRLSSAPEVSAQTGEITGWVPLGWFVRQLKEGKAKVKDFEGVNALDRHEKKMMVLSRDKEWLIKVTYGTTVGFRFNTEDPMPYADGDGDDMCESFHHLMKNVITKVLEKKPMSTTSSMVGGSVR